MKTFRLPLVFPFGYESTPLGSATAPLCGWWDGCAVWSLTRTFSVAPPWEVGGSVSPLLPTSARGQGGGASSPPSFRILRLRPFPGTPQKLHLWVGPLKVLWRKQVLLASKAGPGSLDG